jgi:DNA-binding NtrC family response regulator
MSADSAIEPDEAAVLIVDGDIVSRHVIADYLRHCGYAVVEAATVDEAYVALGEPSLSIDVILCDVSSLGSQSGFALASWVRANRPELEVKLAGGAAMSAETAADLCESGPKLERPYAPEAVVDYINRLRASRES